MSGVCVVRYDWSEVKRDSTVVAIDERRETEATRELGFDHVVCFET